MYYIKFDFDCEGEPPKVFIVDEEGMEIIEVLEQPSSPLGRLVKGSSLEWTWKGVFSWCEEDWQAPPLANTLVEFMNKKGE